MVKNKENELVAVAQESGLQQNKIEALLSGFGDSFHKAKEIAAAANGITVTDESQTKEMQQARQARLELKNVRVAVEKTRKELKEQSLREGKAIDGMANIIKALIVPVEEHLEKQEKFAEIKAAERRARVFAERTAELSQYVDDVAAYDLENITDAAYDAVLAKAKQDKIEAEEAAKKAEAERIAKEKAEAEAREEQRKENERLKKEAAEREKAAAAEREASRKKLEAEQKKRAEIERKQREEAEAKAAEEERVEKIVADFAIPVIVKTIKQANAIGATIKGKYEALNAKDQAEPSVKSAFLGAVDYLRTCIAELEAEEAAKAEHDAAMAPDRDKILKFADALETLMPPEVTSPEGQLLIKAATDAVAKLSDNLRTRAKEL